MNHAWLIIAHNEFEVLQRLVSMLDDVRSDFYIHFDRKVAALPELHVEKGRLHILDELKKPENDDLRANMSAAAHMIHGSSDGRFTITYAVKDITKAEIEGVGFRAADYDEMAKRYDPAKLQYGYNTVDGEQVYFIPNPALGLWIDRERFEKED